jgi:HSP20 family protein
LIFLETKAVAKKGNNQPSSFDNGGWLSNFFNAPLDEYFNLGKVMNVPAVNVTETDTAYQLSIAAPGLEKTDFKVECANGMLTIMAEKEKEEKEEKNGRYNRREYNYSSWSRSFTLPEDYDEGKIDATYKNGELKVSIPRTAAKQAENVKQITVG